MHIAPIYYLEHLRDEDCWQLFAKHAFDNEDLNAYPDLVTIGRRVSEKCKGLPLAVKTLGGVLCYRLDVAKWKRISVKEIRHFLDNESNILPALREYCFTFEEANSKEDMMKHMSELIGELKLLPFPDLSRTSIESLPEPKVASVKDASETELVDKNCLEALCLSWKGHTNDSKHDREILKELLPCTNLKILSIYGYGGRTCPNCYPPSKLSIFTDLCEVLSDGAEFYGFSASNSMRKLFASLEFLSFSEMLAWEEWSSIEAEDGEVFPRLQQTEIYICGRLNTADLPHTVPCSAKLILDGSKVLVSSLPRTSAIQDLKLDKCEEPQLQQPNQQWNHIELTDVMV
ncbi:putative disease resistance protein RGA1 [Ziziphus jujuba]|uniref:Disease resistance protein RGA1 n=1 Tax=Ziziphus jujuba TaxID=326968 RepID=A0ABM3ZYD9_ZIZJJ|nr:putative disease resistance protein RGA1 [Ziziphus jujuba]